MNDLDLTPLSPGALAFRFRIEHRTTLENQYHARPIVTGLQIVEVLEQREEFVIWTNHLRRRATGPAGEKFTHISHRRELIALAWLETLCAAPAENPPVPITGTTPKCALESGAAHPSP
jgi:hypothetical protein